MIYFIGDGSATKRHIEHRCNGMTAKMDERYKREYEHYHAKLQRHEE